MVMSICDTYVTETLQKSVTRVRILHGDLASFMNIPILNVLNEMLSRSIYNDLNECKVQAHKNEKCCLNMLHVQLGKLTK